MIPESTLLCADEEVVSCQFGDGLALLDLRSGQYFSLNRVGAFVWSQLGEAKTLGEIRRAMLDRYDATEAQCSADLHSWVESMARAKLIKASDAAAA
jgi:hypothetical protein